MPVSDLLQLGNSVINGFEQCDAGLLPTPLVADLSALRNTLAEGMTIQFEQLQGGADETPTQQAERENFMDAQRRYEDNIPGYKALTSNLGFDDY